MFNLLFCQVNWDVEEVRSMAVVDCSVLSDIGKILIQISLSFPYLLEFVVDHAL